ncbi:MAG: hypothetical protein ACI957_004117, partial [Verrucomicrobiales bacterium]
MRICLGRLSGISAAVVIMITSSAADLVSYWNFNDGLTAKDQVGPNDGLEFKGFGGGASHTSDVPPGGGAFSLDLTHGTDVVTLPSTDYGIVDAYTISAWVKRDGNGEGRFFAIKRDLTSGGGDRSGIALGVEGGEVYAGHVAAIDDVNDANGGNTFHDLTTTDAVEVNPDTWTHVLVTFKDDFITLWVDGQAESVYVSGGGGPEDGQIKEPGMGLGIDLVDADGSFSGFGADGRVPDGGPDNDTGHFDGFLDEVAVWDEALTEEAIVKLAEGTLPTRLEPDADEDGLPDAYENQFVFLDPNNAADAAADQDGDGLTNLAEFDAQTGPDNKDSDNDGLEDGSEIAEHGTDPADEDTDNDGLSDGAEINTHASNPLAMDTDGDTLSDGDEVTTHGTSPILADSDADGTNDDVELGLGLDPNDSNSKPAAQDVFLATSNDPGMSWEDGSAWADGQPPSPGKDYIVATGVAEIVRSPKSLDPVFGGNALSIRGEDTQLLLNHSGTAMIPILHLEGGTVVLEQRNVGLAGMVAANAASSIDFIQAGRTLNISAAITGAESITVLQSARPAEGVIERSSVLRLLGDGGEYTGDWEIKGGLLEGSRAGSLGRGNILVSGGILDLDYNLSSPDSRLTIASLESRLILDQTIFVGEFFIADTNVTELGAGPYDWEFFNGVQAGASFISEDGTDPTDGGTVPTGRIVVGGDSDSDALPDFWEEEFLGDLTESGGGDSDDDGLDNHQEFAFGSDPDNKDSDGDGLEDGAEANTHGSNPSLRDSDGDGLDDPDEVNIHLTNPALADSDGDSLTDGAEVSTHLTDPLSEDSDGDGAADDFEIAEESDPNDPNDVPPLPNERLKSYWSFDAGTVTDEAGDADAEKIVGGTFSANTPSGAGRALDLTHGKDYVLLPSGNFGIDDTDEFTISAWVNYSSSERGVVSIMQDLTSGGGDRSGITLGISGNGQLFMGIIPSAPSTEPDAEPNEVGDDAANGAGSNFRDITSDLEVPTNQWVHLAATFGEDQLVMYVDGLPATEYGGGGEQILEDGSEMTFGRGIDFIDTDGSFTGFGASGNGPEHGDSAGDFTRLFYDGLLDDVGIWDAALLPEDVSRLANGETPAAVAGGGGDVGGGDPNDSDADGLPDAWENVNFGDLTKAADGDEDGDELSNASELAANTDPNKADSDDDGLDDGAEITTGSDPLSSDSDGDRLADGDEVNIHGTDPTMADSDGDGSDDGVEIAEGSDPNDAASVPSPSDLELVAYWNFDDGATVTDAAADNDAVEINGATFSSDTPSGNGNALDLTNGMDYVSLPAHDYGIVDEFTLAAWVKYTDSERSFFSIKRDLTSGGGDRSGISLGVQNGKAYVGIVSGAEDNAANGGTTFHDIESDSEVPSGKW